MGANPSSTTSSGRLRTITPAKASRVKSNAVRRALCGASSLISVAIISPAAAEESLPRMF